MSAAVVAPIIVVAAFVVQFLVQRRITSNCDYECGRCGQTFSLSPLAATIAPHRLGGSKLVRCAHCGRFTWVTPVPKLGP